MTASPSPKKFSDDQYYVIDGEVMNKLWQLTERLCDGNRMNEVQRNGVGQSMQLHLERAPRLAKKIARFRSS